MSKKNLEYPPKKSIYFHKILFFIVGNYNISSNDIISVKVAKVLQYTKSVRYSFRMKGFPK
jgi:hypothetical protein